MPLRGTFVYLVKRLSLAKTILRIRKAANNGMNPIVSLSGHSALCVRSPSLRSGVVTRTRSMERDAVSEMKVGPSEPVCKSRLQTAVGCWSRKTTGGERMWKRRVK